MRKDYHIDSSIICVEITLLDFDILILFKFVEIIHVTNHVNKCENTEDDLVL